jgi:ribosomal protein L17
MLSTFSQMKQGVLDEESKKSKKSQSKDGRPVIEQLRLLTCTKEDDFKLPRSFSKRSTSKNLDKSREKKSSVTEIFENFYQEARVVDEKKRSMGYMECLVAQRRFKPLSVKNLMKDKLEKTALEKFKDAVSNENN